MCDLFRANRETAQQPSGILDMKKAVPEGAADLVVEPRHAVIETKARLRPLVEIRQPGHILPVDQSSAA